MFYTKLPIDAVLGDIRSTLASTPCAVLVAPPGAGKTTRVPLALLDEPWAAGGKILVLEPRRLAARAAARRMAQTLGEAVGGTVGFRTRLASEVSRRTRIEVVTEGIFTRMVLDDPELSGIAAVLFDEFHERSLDADLGLALALDSQRGLRDDLRLLAMSATLDGARVASLMGLGTPAPVIESEGRAFPVETAYLGRDPRAPIDRQMADAIRRALEREDGSILAFLPGAAEIRRTETLLLDAVRDPKVDIVALFGALDAAEQDRAVLPAPEGRRKVVLATSIAETSLTIEGVRVVVDSGLARVPRFEPDVGLTRLETVRVSRAAADQRRGRAGRTEPGVCYRLWSEGETASLPAFATPEILAADLTGLVLDLARVGVRDPAALPFLDPPPAPAVTEAKALLRLLGALDAEEAVTPLGCLMARLPLPPRLAHMVAIGAARGMGRLGAEIAALLVERGLGGDSVDLLARLDGFRRDRSRRAEDSRRLAGRWAEMAARELAADACSPGTAPPLSPAALLALAFPDRVAKAREGRAGETQVRFLMANGRGAVLEGTSPLARAPFLAVAEASGRAEGARITLAAALSAEQVEALFADDITSGLEVAFDPAAMAVRAREVRRLKALVLAARPQPVPADAETARALARGIADADIGRLPFSAASRQWRERVMFLRAAEGEPWPDLSDAALAASVETWLAPFLSGRTALADISGADVGNALHALLPYELTARLEAEAPTHFAAPTGSRLAIDYGAEGGPAVEVRVQELFGLTAHPAIAGGRVPLTLALLSPAHRPIQVTKDLPQFWRGSWRDVRADMRGRYPKHPWPEDPAAAPPTTRAKPRGT
ncbi:ATP-dependent helicase HrpB [Xanthobacter sp. YC-JY1]|uniref:ATP-dependent helicase HrpB n=1 Tax=Xanthobacter sp. YC-JY1 TaxID=2419844 RepID=UPI001F00A2EC|nr:ATP-dependent helicase HrpB [Xanthobacter sp. YC-JY1]UJX43387.1 ATP-dependent helicase HrpB [Xanthobacter sp. YC-JY1]